jgi:hypothetical protein
MKGKGGEIIKSITPILVLALILGVVGISGCTDLASQNNTYSKNGISFSYPSNWQEGDPSDLLKGEIVAVLDPNSTNSDKATTNEKAYTVVIVGTKSLSKGSTLTSYYNDLVKQGHNYQSYTRVSNREFTLDGQPAYEIVYTNKMDNGKIGKTREVLLERNGKVYDISCTSVDDFDKNTANFDMIINSFKVQ